MYFLSPQEYGTLNVVYKTDDHEALTLQSDELWNEMFPGVRPFRNYLDENIAQSFEFENVMGASSGKEGPNDGLEGAEC